VIAEERDLPNRSSDGSMIHDSSEPRSLRSDSPPDHK
jgi:hypothetical protein